MDELLTCAEVCDLLKTSRASLRRHVNDGLFPAPVRLGRRGVRWRTSDIEQWIADRTPVSIKAAAREEEEVVT